MVVAKLHDNFYEKIKLCLYQRIGRELRLAYRVLDLGCGACELVRYLSEACGQKVTGVDISTNSFPNNRNITKNVHVKVCGTCKVRCGIHKGEPYFEGAHEAKMAELAEWIKEADKVITF